MTPDHRTILLGIACLLVSACSDGSSTDLGADVGTTALALQPALITGPADATAAPVNRIRARVLRTGDGAEVTTRDFDVSPTSDSWNIEVSVPLPREAVEVEVVLRLINVGTNGSESVEFSGRTTPITLRPSTTSAQPSDVTLVRGSLGNLSVQDITIAGAPPALLPGETFDLQADLALSDPTPVEAPEVFWVSLDPTVTSLSGSQATAVASGQTRIVAVSGAHADTVDAAVLPSVSSITLSPASATLTGFGGGATFVATVLDGRGDTIAVPDIIWGTTTPQILRSLGGGSFEPIGLGQGIVEATSGSTPSVVATGQVTVDPILGDLALDKTVSNSQPTTGDTIRLDIVATNAANFAARGVTVRETLPSGLIYLSAAASSGSFDPASDVWTLDPLGAGSAATLSLDVEVGTGTGGSALSATAALTPPADYQDSNAANDTSVVTVFPAGGSSNPSPNSILFLSQRSSPGDVFVMDPDGSNPTNLTNTTTQDLQPVWSPDRSRIAFVSQRDGNSEIYVMDWDGANPVRLTTNATLDYFPRWSPDGTQIAFTNSQAGVRDIYVMNADGSNPINISNSPGYSDFAPEWSPDGSQIAFMSDRTGANRIWVMNPDGSNAVQLTTSSGSHEFPDWSPDGTRIAYSRDSGVGYQIYLINADGSNDVQIQSSSGDDRYPTWSPDGTQIAFTSTRDGNQEIYLMNADGSGATNLTNDPANDAQPAWNH